VTSRKACEGGATRSVRTTEHMEECLACGTCVRFDLVRHPHFGFQNCDRKQAVSKDSAGEGGRIASRG
jgi:hypothetical protein